MNNGESYAEVTHARSVVSDVARGKRNRQRKENGERTDGNEAGRGDACFRFFTLKILNTKGEKSENGHA